jgi:hypothetical protein
MEYVFEELSVEEIAAIKLPPEPAPTIPEVVFEDISLDDISNANGKVAAKPVLAIPQIGTLIQIDASGNYVANFE